MISKPRPGAALQFTLCLKQAVLAPFPIRFTSSVASGFLNCEAPSVRHAAAARGRWKIGVKIKNEMDISFFSRRLNIEVCCCHQADFGFKVQLNSLLLIRITLRIGAWPKRFENHCFNPAFIWLAAPCKQKGHDIIHTQWEVNSYTLK